LCLFALVATDIRLFVGGAATDGPDGHGLVGGQFANGGVGLRLPGSRVASARYTITSTSMRAVLAAKAAAQLIAAPIGLGTISEVITTPAPGTREPFFALRIARATFAVSTG